MEKGKIEFGDPTFREISARTTEWPDSQEKRFSEDDVRGSFHFMMDQTNELKDKLAIAVEALEKYAAYEYEIQERFRWAKEALAKIGEI